MRLRFLSIVVLLLMGYVPSVRAQDVRLQLQVELITGARAPFLKFKGRNVSAAPIEKGVLGVKTNRIHLLRPDGSVSAPIGIIDTFVPAEPEMWQPGEEVTWQRAISDMSTEMKLPGDYRLYWEFGRDRSNVITLKQDARPTTSKPVTQPAKFVQSARRPKDALLSFYMAYDGDGLINSFVTYDEANPNELEAVRALNLRAAAAGDFRKWVRVQFGAEGGSVGWFYEVMDAGIVERIEKATVTYDEYFREATVQLGEKGWVVRLIRNGREDDEWKVSVTNYMREGKIDWRIPMQTKILEKERERIADGVYKTIRDARESAREQFWAAGGPKLKD